MLFFQSHFDFPAKILEELIAYCKQFSQRIGYAFHRGSIRLTALTGSAATEIGGETTAREFKLMTKSESASVDDIQEFNDTRMCIIDEISFADHDQVLAKLSSNLQNFTECYSSQFGSVPVVFLGDFRQLEAIGDNSILKHPNSIYWEQALNCMVELEGTHRYNKCSSMKEIMPTVRNEGLTDEHRAILNSRVINGKDVKMPNIAETRFATYHNRKRCELNASVFKEYLKKYHSDCDETNIPKTAIVIKANATWTRSKTTLSYGHRKVLFEQCCEADIKNGYNKRCDPMLTLFSGCHLMGTDNDDVANGIANGTTSIFKQAVLKPGAKPTPMKLHGFWVYAIDVADVDHLVLEWHDSLFRGKFKVSPSKGPFRVNFPIVDEGRKMRVKAGITFEYFPLVLNHATTGHKLQGKSMDQLVIAEWSKVKNWAYVVLSRVRTLDGLYLLEPIPDDIDFSPDPNYLAMMERLRSRILASPDDIADLLETYQFPENL